MPMLPGLAVFRAVFSFAVDGNFDNGIRQMMSAIAIALALGSGVVLGEFIGSPLRYRAGRIGDFIRKEGPPGLRRAVGRVVHLAPAEDQPSEIIPRTRSVALQPKPTGDAQEEIEDSDASERDESTEQS